MKKSLLIILSISVVLFIVVAFSYSRAKKTSEQPRNDSKKTAVDQLQEKIEMVDSKGGVDVSIDEIKRENNQTILTIGINNHAVDYSTVDLKERANLDGKKPIKYEVDSAASGGHHVAAQMVFDGNLSGSLTIRLTDELVFNIDVR
ncbi:MAG: hypothetical protein AAB348_01960 [Patescibacteria group bacterium]